MLNDLVAWAFVVAGVSVAKEPVGLVRQDGKRPDGFMLISFEGDKSLTWDVTVVRSTAESYIDLSRSWQNGRDGSFANEAKYVTVQTHYDFQPIAVETLGRSRPLLFCKIWVGEFRLWAERTASDSFQRISVIIGSLTRCFCMTVFLSSDHPD